MDLQPTRLFALLDGSGHRGRRAQKKVAGALQGTWPEGHGRSLQKPLQKPSEVLSWAREGTLPPLGAGKWTFSGHISFFSDISQKVFLGEAQQLKKMPL